MTGILETMKSQLDGALADIAALKAAAAPAPVTAAAADPFASLGGAASPPPPPPAPANVTGEQITALIQPHIENVAVKEALGAEMRAMGINALPETKVEQYPELYQRFQAVIARFSGAAAPAAAASASSII